MSESLNMSIVEPTIAWVGGADSVTGGNWNIYSSEATVRQARRLQGVSIPMASASPIKTTTGTVNTPSPQEARIMAKLIRYTVVDPDAVLADKTPEAAILLGGTCMLNGSDEKGFLMDLAPKVAEKLEAHNRHRGTVEYEDEEGRTKTLKPVRLGQLDVVIEVLKAYSA